LARDEHRVAEAAEAVEQLGLRALPLQQQRQVEAGIRDADFQQFVDASHRA